MHHLTYILFANLRKETKSSHIIKYMINTDCIIKIVIQDVTGSNRIVLHIVLLYNVIWLPSASDLLPGQWGASRVILNCSPEIITVNLASLFYQVCAVFNFTEQVQLCCGNGSWLIIAQTDSCRNRCKDYSQETSICLLQAKCTCSIRGIFLYSESYYFILTILL